MDERKSRSKWDTIYRSKTDFSESGACKVLLDYQHLLPVTADRNSRALDIACGLGGNALFLSDRGYQVTAIDISAVAVEHVASFEHASINAYCAAIDQTLLQGLRSDIIVVSRYLDRNICSALMDSLNPDGILFYQTFTQDKADPSVGPGNPEYLLAPNELLTLFSGLRVLAFADQGQCGDCSKGFRNESFLVAQKSTGGEYRQ